MLRGLGLLLRQSSKIDMAVEMMSLLEIGIGRLVIATADSDYLPIVDACHRQGVQVLIKGCNISRWLVQRTMTQEIGPEVLLGKEATCGRE